MPALVEGNVEVVIASGGSGIVTGGARVGGGALGATTIVVVAEVTWAGLLLSVTAVAKVEVPLAVGTPVMPSIDDERFRPAGKWPATIAQV